MVFETAKEFLPIQVEPSRTVEITCDVPDETTPATWFKDDVKLVSDGVKYEMATKETKRSLVVHDVKPEDAGQYVCEVGPHRTTATLEVLKPEEKEIKGSFTTDGMLECACTHRQFQFTGIMSACSSLSQNKRQFCYTCYYHFQLSLHTFSHYLMFSLYDRIAVQSIKYVLVCTFCIGTV